MLVDHCFTCMCISGWTFLRCKHISSLFLYHTSPVTMSLLRINLTLKLDIASINPLPCPAAPYKRIMCMLYLSAKVWYYTNRYLSLYYYPSLSFFKMIVLMCLRRHLALRRRESDHGQYHHSFGRCNSAHHSH